MIRDISRKIADRAELKACSMTARVRQSNLISAVDQEVFDIELLNVQ